MAGVTTLRFDHIGVVVAEMQAGREFFENALGVDRWTEVFEDGKLGVAVQFGAAGDGPCYELVAPLGETSPVLGALRGTQRILNHVAYLTEDLEASGSALAEQGCRATGDAQPALAYGGRQIQFWVSPLRFLVELIEAPGHEHRYRVPGLIERSAGAPSGNLEAE